MIELYCYRKDDHTKFVKKFWYDYEARRYVKMCRKNGDVVVYGCSCDEVEEIDYIMDR